MLSSIEKGYFVLIGIESRDTKQKADYLAEKLSRLRIMANAEVKMNLTIGSVGGEMLVVSQFTLLADTAVGNRPSFIAAARPEVAESLYDHFVKKLIDLDIKVKTGEFGADINN